MTAIPHAGFPGQVQAVVQRCALVTRLHYHPSTESTNAVAVDLARADAPHGTLVLADAQQAGRGRHGRGWSSPPGLGLWFSWILRPDLPLNRAYLVTWAGALAATDVTARAAGVSARIKWPNDVQVGGRKICGLLAEVGGRKKDLGYIVLGTGINVNQVESDFPPEFREQASSLRLCGRKPVDRALAFAAFLEAFEFEYRRLLKDGGAAIRRDWTLRSSVLGRDITVQRNGEAFGAKATGVNEDGALLIERNGVVEAIHSADIELLRVKE